MVQSGNPRNKTKKYGRAFSALQHNIDLHDSATPGSIFLKTMPSGWTNMSYSKTLHVLLTFAVISGGTATAIAQPIFDRMREDAERRAEHKAVTDAEHPAATTAADQPATQAAPATQATPATPADPADPVPSAPPASPPPAPHP